MNSRSAICPPSAAAPGSASRLSRSRPKLLARARLLPLVQKLAYHVALFAAVRVGDKPVNQLALRERVWVTVFEALDPDNVAGDPPGDAVVLDTRDGHEHLLGRAGIVAKVGDHEEIVPSRQTRQ